ncbi:hypothetical protein ES703_84597 [subsurface metagenome]
MKGARGFVVSCIGYDQLGKEILNTLDKLELSSEYIAIDKNHTTGSCPVAGDPGAIGIFCPMAGHVSRINISQSFIRTYIPGFFQFRYRCIIKMRQFKMRYKITFFMPDICYKVFDRV